MDGLDEEILNGTGYFHALLGDIAAAKKTIWLETYIYGNDYFGATLADALIAAVNRGVTVRVLVDGIGTPFFHRYLEKMEAAGVVVRVYHPIPFNFAQAKRSSYQANFIFKLLYFFTKINSRNHRKTCIIDENIVYVGSANIDQRHLNKALGGEDWFDVIVRLTNVNAKNLAIAFNLAWDRFYLLTSSIEKKSKKTNLKPIFRLNYSRRLRRELYKSLLRRIRKAKDRIWVTSPYFNPDYFILKRLTDAAKRGVDVKIIFPEKSDVIFSKIIAVTFYTKLLKSGVSIYEYSYSVLHAKVLNIDDWFSAGSSNLNYRSFRHDLEVDVHIQTINSKKKLQQQFIENLKQTIHIDQLAIKKQKIVTRIVAYFLLFLKSYM